MKKLFLVAAIFTIALPFASDPSLHSDHSTQFSPKVLAGHTGVGSWCECGCPECICDPGEEPTCNNGMVISEKPQKSKPQTQPSDRSRSDAGDPLSVGLVFALLFFFWIRFRG